MRSLENKALAIVYGLAVVVLAADLFLWRIL
jgi:hypothetical protein